MPSPTDPGAPSEAREASAAGDPLNEVLTAWIGALLLSWAGWQLAPEGYGGAVTALAWALVPLGLVALGRVRLRDLGLGAGRPLAGLAWLVGVSLIVLPLFGVGVVAWERWQGNTGWTAPPLAVLVGFVGPQLLLAGLPEELFFRGFAQRRLGDLFAGGDADDGRRGLLPSARRLEAIVAASLLFGLSHVVFLANPLSLAGIARFTTFFPGLLFGLLRERTGAVWAPALFHALCNAWLFWLYAGFG